MASASTPVPRTKLFEAVRLFPTVPVKATLFRLHPSAQMLMSRQFCTLPPVPEAQKPDIVCLVHMFSANQLFPVVSIAPPQPSATVRLLAFESTAKFRTVHEIKLKIAPSGFGLGSGILRYTLLCHMPAP